MTSFDNEPQFLYSLAQEYYAKTDDYDTELFGLNQQGEINLPTSQLAWRRSNRYAVDLLYDLQRRAAVMGFSPSALAAEMRRYDQRHK